MPDVQIEKPAVIDILSEPGTPALSSTTDMPVIETKPDAQAALPLEEAEDDKTGESATPPESTSADDKPKQAKGVQKRLEELTRQREDERRRADAADAEKLRLLALLEKAGQREEPKQAAEDDDPEPTKPIKSAYTDPDEYDNARDSYAVELGKWTARKETKAILSDRETKEREATAATQVRATYEAYAARVDKAKEKYPDYAQVAESPDVAISIPMAHAIIQSDVGTDIAYHLGKNPEEAKRIASLSVPLQLVELGKIAVKLETPSPAPAPKPVSAAPAPVKPIKQAGDAAKTPEEMTMEEYAEFRKPQLKMRPGVRH
jgi:hypothetical protein